MTAAIIAYLVIGATFAFGLIADRAYGHGRFNPDSISDWLAGSAVAVLVGLAWPVFVCFCEYEECSPAE